MLKLQVIGRLTADASVKDAQNGEKYVTFDIAENRKKSDGTTETTFLRAFMRDAPALVQYLKKGAQVFVEGRGSVRMYVGADGMAKASLSVRTSSGGIQLLGGPQKEGAAAGSGTTAQNKDYDLPW